MGDPVVFVQEVHRFQPSGLSAASGLVIRGERFYCIGDDELHLVVIPLSLDGSEARIELLTGVLPDEVKARKAAKPDLESLVLLPDNGSILCLPSGSTPHRHRGVLLDRQDQVKELSFMHTFEALRKGLPELNIEGAVVIDQKIRLFQRGNGGSGVNALIDLPLDAFLSDAVVPFEIRQVELGSHPDGSRWGFTDACRDGDSIWFLAVSEETLSTYADGAYRGAKLGRMDLDGNILALDPLDVPFKPEGLVLRGNHFFVVTDADDRMVPSRLYRGILSFYGNESPN
jgi:hypothetical protein